jgi:hypothetical protein
VVAFLKLHHDPNAHGKEKAAPAISTDAALSKITGIYQT